MSSTGIQDVNAAGGKSQSDAVRRWGPVIGGSALALYGITRRSLSGLTLAAVGGAAIYLGAKQESLEREPVAHASVLINATPAEIYNFWRNFENLPTFMRHLESVRVTGDGRSHWTAIGPLGARVSWDAEIINQREGESIEWHSLPDSDLLVDGFVHFRPAPADRGTIVRAIVRYTLPRNKTGRNMGHILGKYPEFIMQQDLRRLKALIETGEIPTTEGQPHGPRSVIGKALHLANPDRPLTAEWQINKVLEAMRRIA